MILGKNHWLPRIRNRDDDLMISSKTSQAQGSVLITAGPKRPAHLYYATMMLPKRTELRLPIPSLSKGCVVPGRTHQGSRPDCLAHQDRHTQSQRLWQSRDGYSHHCSHRRHWSLGGKADVSGLRQNGREFRNTPLLGQ